MAMPRAVLNLRVIPGSSFEPCTTCVCFEVSDPCFRCTVTSSCPRRTDLLTLKAFPWSISSHVPLAGDKAKTQPRGCPASGQTHLHPVNGWFLGCLRNPVCYQWRTPNQNQHGTPNMHLRISLCSLAHRWKFPRVR